MIASTRAREKPRTFVPNSNDDDVIINYITDMDLGIYRRYAPKIKELHRWLLGN